MRFEYIDKIAYNIKSIVQYFTVLLFGLNDPANLRELYEEKEMASCTGGNTSYDKNM